MRNTLIVVMCSTLLSACLEPVETNMLDSEPGLADESGNASPTITGNPQQAVLYADLYRFRPKASDADGDTLTFSVLNKPEWAEFDAATGALWGQPEMGNIGVYDGIVISVSDGVDRDSLPAFSITVSMDALGSVTLNWEPPTQNTDGSPLTDLAGYFIYVGDEPGVYVDKIRINNAGVTSYVVDRLLPTTYYFAASSFNSAGVESELSLEASKTVN